MANRACKAGDAFQTEKKLEKVYLYGIMFCSPLDIMTLHTEIR